MYRRMRPGRGLPATAHYFDVFEMSGIRLDSKPVFRVKVHPDYRCMAGDFSLRGLQVVNGVLTYLTRERTPGEP